LASSTGFFPSLKVDCTVYVVGFFKGAERGKVSPNKTEFNAFKAGIIK